MNYFKTEITSADIVSDNPMHQRLLFPYKISKETISGNVLELGCGWGRGINDISQAANRFTGVDRNHALIRDLRNQYPQHTFKTAILPNLEYYKSDQYDYVISFQVIEHIKHDRKFLSEIRRMLKPGGKLILTTCNRSLSLTRNPWHIREYHADDLKALLQDYFDVVELFGIGGNELIWEYYNQNKLAVQRLVRWDIMNLQQRLPSWMLKEAYEIGNRFTRNNLLKQSEKLTKEITWSDYNLNDKPEDSFDFYCVCY